jgi:HAD superfamily hydrolase (TIGR01662 family)
MNYNLILFDADGTLTPMREGSTGDFDFTILPNVRKKLAELHRLGIQLGICSNQSKNRSMEAIREQFEWISKELKIPANSIMIARGEHQKPSPVMLEKSMALVYASPDETLFVGDAETDRMAAEAAGVSFQYAEEFFGWEKKVWE